MATLREDLSDYAHESWAGWMKYMFRTFTGVKRGDRDVTLNLPVEVYDRWTRQMNTPYAYLSDGEKDSDRREADQIIKIVQKHV